MKTRHLKLLTVFAVAVSFSGCGPAEKTEEPPPSDSGPGARSVRDAGPPDSSEAIARNNRGVGLMGRFDYAEARRVFEELAARYPDWLEVRVNLAVAVLNAEQGGETALKLLAEVLKADPDHVRANYCTGLLLYHVGRYQEAVPHLKKALEAGGRDAYPYFLIARCLEDESQETAIEWHEKAIEADPYFQPAYYRLFSLLRGGPHNERALEMLAEFQRLQKDPRARVFEFKYTRMGPKALALAVGGPAPQPATRPSGPLFLEAAPLLGATGAADWSPPAEDRQTSITAADTDGDGRVDLLFFAAALRNGAETANAVCRVEEDGTVAFEPEHPLSRIDGVTAALWGDYDNDGLCDVYLCRRGPNQLWRQTAANDWENVTAATNTAGGDAHTVDGAFFDADHDGDLDVFLVNADGANELLNNNRDGTFRPIAGEAGIAGDGRPSRRVVVADLDGDRDTDLIVLNDRPPHDVFLNDRGWTYRRSQEFVSFAEAPVAAAVAGDLNSDGRVELYGLEADGLARWEPVAEGTWRRDVLTDAARLGGVRATDADISTAAGRARLALCDVTGDGRLELLAGAGGRWQVLKTHGAQAEPLPAPAADGPRGWSPVLLEAARGPAVVGLPDDGPPLIWRPGSGRHRFVAVSLTGKEQGKDQVRSNASGLGARVEARVGSQWTVVDYLRPDSGPGQSLQPLAIGLAGRDKADFVRITWPDGVSQSELDLAAGLAHRIEEIDRMPTSCPVLFAWNGRRYQFVSDLLGVGGLGYLTAPGEYATPDPTENFLLPAGVPVPRGGRYVFKLTEPMEELTFLDFAGLSAYDLPPGWRMTLDERMGTGAPPPTGRPRFYRRSLRPRQAINDRGEDVTDAVGRADHAAAPPGALDPRFIGRLHSEHVLHLKFDEPLDAGAGEPMLIADGWIEYPYSQTIFAAWQAGAAFQPPTLEARDANGDWRVVLKEFGYPAGMPRQMSVPLADLPAGATELRLRTNQEIYWDLLQIAWAEPCPRVRRRSLQLAAEIGESGFMPRIIHEQRRPSFDYDQRVPLAETRDPAGLYTRFGPVEELLSRADDALAIFGPGEEIHLEFTDSLPPLPPDWNRRFVLETVGWCKDMDLYTENGETVAPLPARSTASSPARRLHERYNTRCQAGR